jgi:isopenicillin N synthase-like dioxygenase
MRPMAAIPVIDLRRASERDVVTAQAVGDALRDIGFFAVENHGIPQELIERAYAAANEFFSLPDEVKRRYARPDLYGQRGYTGFAGERAIGARLPDLKEFFQIGRATGASTYGPNVWPAETPSFRGAFAELFDRLEGLAMRLAAACSVYLERPADYLPSLIVRGESVLRIIHYPPLPPDARGDALRAAAHADINFLTLLCGATAEGLEIQTRDGRWQAVEARRGRIVVDSGDMLQHLTGGLFRSTTHRVVNPVGRNTSRLSLPFFVHPRSEVDLTPDPEIAGRGTASGTFAPVTAGEFLRERLARIRPEEQRNAP